MYVGFWLLIVSVVTGQLTRLPGVGVLTDILVPLFLGFWLLDSVKNRKGFPFDPIVVWVLVFSLYLLFGLLVNLDSIPALGGEIGSFLYWVRLVVYLGLVLPFLDMWRSDKDRFLRTLWWSVVGTGSILSLLGFIQLAIFPDFSFMAQYGWDPHQGRLLSTWYDPNFLGGVLGISLSLLVSRMLVRISDRDLDSLTGSGLLWLVLIAVQMVALVLTYSRSALLAFLVGMVVLSFGVARWALLVLVICLGVALVSSPRLQERVVGAFQLDVTASLRVENWMDTLEDIERNPIVGIGYNTVKYQTIVPSELNSASGRDSSLLTLWLTSGVIGLGLFLGMIGFKIVHLLRLGVSGDSELERSVGFGIVSAISVLLVHSMFVNSIFFPHILLFLVLFLVI